MANSFELLLEEGMISSPDLAARLGKMSRFRNLIVHRYWAVDYAVVHDILSNHLSDFREFASQIGQFLDSKGL